MENKAMLTDLYQLTMGAVYHADQKEDTATFDLFIRKLPTDWGYFVANGIEDAIDYITNIKFEDKDLAYLSGQGLPKGYLDSLKDFKFEGEVYAVAEGTPVFANEPVLRVTAKRGQAQFVESALLNIINSQTLIASKASRIVAAAKGRPVIDFGLRRAQGEDAAMTGARACYIAGAVATATVKAGLEYGIPISGTMAHSLVMSYEKEIDAFRAYVRTFPDNSTLLIDTYDTIQGAKNAAIVAKELESLGHKLKAVRIDSGDIAGMSKVVRNILDSDNLSYVKIIATNDLNEYKIADLDELKARIDGFGVGTEMITAKPISAIPGVYKLVEDSAGSKIKLSEGKQSLPGKKQLYRILGADGKYAYDKIVLDGEASEGTPLLTLAVASGKRAREKRNLNEIRAYSLAEVAKLPESLRTLRVSGEYKIEIGTKLEHKIAELTRKHTNDRTTAERIFSVA